MPAARRQRERCARRRGHESSLRIEQVEQRKQIELVRTAAVQEHERALRLACCGADARLEAHRRIGSYFARMSSR